MHTVIQVGEDGKILSAARLNTEDQVEKKRSAMELAGQVCQVLWHSDLSGDISLLYWDSEQGRITRRSETLSELRAPVLLRIQEYFAAAVQADLTLAGGDVVQGDGRAQHLAKVFATGIRAGEASPHGGIWRTRDNRNIDFSDADMLALDAEFSGRTRAMQMCAWALKDAVRAETDPALIKAFDIAAQWDAALAEGA